MKITVKDATSEKPICLKDLEPGTVFEFNDGVFAVKGCYKDDGFLLTYSSGTEWFEKIVGYKSVPIKHILGKLVEIVVEPI